MSRKIKQKDVVLCHDEYITESRQYKSNYR